MAYYDKIALKWHKITGYKGGAFKTLILNEEVISRVDTIDAKSILELGAGNGYFMPLLLKKKSGQVPTALRITDISTKNLEIAKKHFSINFAQYQMLNIYKTFPIENNSVDLVLSNMVFNELEKSGIENGFSEIKRTLKQDGKFIISVLHPDFIEKQIENGIIKNKMMKSKDGLKIPSIRRTKSAYIEILDRLGFTYELIELFGNEQLYNAKPILSKLKETPIALIISAKV